MDAGLDWNPVLIENSICLSRVLRTLRPFLASGVTNRTLFLFVCFFLVYFFGCCWAVFVVVVVVFLYARACVCVCGGGGGFARARTK